MMEYYSEVSLKVSKVITNAYSTSFSIGIKSLHRDLHNPIYAIYGFVRLSDEIVDSFEGYEQKQLLDTLEKDTFEAIDSHISINPVLHSFQNVVNQFNIDHTLIKQFLHSMRMDLDDSPVHDQSSYELYILGSAEVVGLMCLKVFCEGNEEQYSELKPAAQKLGSAFQKVNFLRDFKADYFDLKRTYFPEVNLDTFDQDQKRNIEIEIANDFKDAEEGIAKLPKKARFGTYIAFKYYCELLKRIEQTKVEDLLEKRIRVPNRRKYSIFFVCLVKRGLGII